MKRFRYLKPLVLAVVGAGVISVGVLLFIPNYRADPGIQEHQFEMEALIVGLRVYHAEYGTFPSGNVSDIIRALNGDNPRRIVFLEKSNPEDSILVDTWGNRYGIKFGQNLITVLSAGPDGMWETDDDIVKEKRIEQGDPSDSSPGTGSEPDDR